MASKLKKPNPKDYYTEADYKRAVKRYNRTVKNTKGVENAGSSFIKSVKDAWASRNNPRKPMVRKKSLTDERKKGAWMNKGEKPAKPTAKSTGDYYGPGGKPTSKQTSKTPAPTKPTPKPAPKPQTTAAPKPKPLPKKQTTQEVKKAGNDPMMVWAKANAKMIEKSGTKKQKELLRRYKEHGLKKPDPFKSEGESKFPATRRSTNKLKIGTNKNPHTRKHSPSDRWR